MPLRHMNEQWELGGSEIKIVITNSSLEAAIKRGVLKHSNTLTKCNIYDAKSNIIMYDVQ